MSATNAEAVSQARTVAKPSTSIYAEGWYSMSNGPAYDGWQSRQGLVVALRSKFPCATLGEIGEVAGVSRERVRQLLKKNGVPTRAYRTPPQLYACMTCGKASTYVRFCSAECRLEVSHPRVSCAWCHSEFRRNATQIKVWAIRGSKQGPFCSRRCFYAFRGAYHLGRPRQELPAQDIVDALARHESVAKIADDMGISKAKVYRFIRETDSNLNPKRTLCRKKS